MRTYDLSLAAEEDLRDIWSYTYGAWGIEQAKRYFDQIEACCDAVGEGRARSRSFNELPASRPEPRAGSTLPQRGQSGEGLCDHPGRNRSEVEEDQQAGFRSHPDIGPVLEKADTEPAPVST
jgi:plasmid stabilization system protein ParE